VTAIATKKQEFDDWHACQVCPGCSWTTSYYSFDRAREKVYFQRPINEVDVTHAQGLVTCCSSACLSLWVKQFFRRVQITPTRPDLGPIELCPAA
jgi:hypothetical protein